MPLTNAQAQQNIIDIYTTAGLSVPSGLDPCPTPMLNVIANVMPNQSISDLIAGGWVNNLNRVLGQWNGAEAAGYSGDPVAGAISGEQGYYLTWDFPPQLDPTGNAGDLYSQVAEKAIAAAISDITTWQGATDTPDQAVPGTPSSSGGQASITDAAAFGGNASNIQGLLQNVFGSFKMQTYGYRMNQAHIAIYDALSNLLQALAGQQIISQAEIDAIRGRVKRVRAEVMCGTGFLGAECFAIFALGATGLAGLLSLFEALVGEAAAAITTEIIGRAISQAFGAGGGVSVDEVLQRLGVYARGDLRNYVDDNLQVSTTAHTLAGLGALFSRCYIDSDGTTYNLLAECKVVDAKGTLRPLNEVFFGLKFEEPGTSTLLHAMLKLMGVEQPDHIE